MGLEKNKVRILNIRKVNFQLFKMLVNRTPWEATQKDKGPEKSWQIFKDMFHTAKQLSISKCKKSRKDSKGPA